MASGNMGDLWFQLGVKDNTSNELQKIIEKLSKGEDKANDMLRAIQGFGYKKNFKEQAEQASKFVDILNTLNRELVKLKKDDSKRDEYASLKKSIDNALNYLNLLQRINVERSKVAELRTLNPNVDTAKLEKADGLLKNINDQLLRLQNDARGGGGNGVNKADILSEYSKALQMTIRDVRQLTSEFKRENPLSAFSGGSAKVEADIARVTEKLAKMRDLMSEGTTKGFNTSMLSGSITELDKVLARLQSAQGNKSLLTDAAQMKNLLSDVAVEMTKASAATQAYGREKGKIIAQDKEAANEYDRQKRQREASKAAQEAELKAMSDYAKRYMELQEAKRKADEKATADAKRESEKRTAQVQSDTRKMSELYSILGVAKDKAEKVGMNGLALNVDTSKLEAKLRVAEDLMNRIFNENVKTLGLGGRMSSSDYATEVRNVKRALDDATASQKELNRAKEQSNKTNKREAEKKAAQDARDAANAEKQRQSEIKKSESRYDALDRALVKLRAEAEKSVTLKVDTTKIDAKIHELESKIQYVASIMNQLKGGDLSAIGKLGGIGTGRDITLANRLLSSQAEANKEAANEYDRQKRQREASKAAQEAELKAMSDYAKRYMELQEAKRKADEKATADAKRESEKRTAQVQSDTRKMSELYSILGVAKDKAEKVGMNGLALNVDTSKLEAKLRVAEDLMNRIFNENVKTLGLGGRMSSSDYATEVRNVKRALDDATASQKELNRAKEQSNKTNKREAEKKAAQDARDAANAEKQRQSEIKKSESRYDALDRALVKLRAEAEKSVTLKVDTTKIDAKIHELESKIQYVASIMNQLKGGDLSAIGKLGGIGTGRDITLANRLLSSQAEANKEAAKGIEIEQKRQREIARSAAKARNDLASAFSKANEEAKKMQGIVGDIKSLFLQGGLVFGAQQFAMSIITTGGEMEKQHIALQSILGDMQNANTMFNQIKDLALNSPFTFSELNRDVKQLAAYGVEYDQLYDTTKRLADMSSGLGVSFDRIALAFGQVQARGWLDGKELRQIAYAGIPLLSKLSEFYSKREGKKVSTSEIKTRISKREVSFDDVKSIFWEMTDAGGQFYNMQQTLSETLLGRYNKLKDAWEIMLAEFASGNSLVGSFFKTALDGATALVQSLHSLAMPVGTLFAGYALKKMLTGNTASSFLSNKENMASNIQARMLQGQQISQVEQRILATKNQITGADLRTLASARALTTEKLNQLRLSGQITAEQYRTYRGIVLRQTGEKTFRMELLRSLVAMRTMSLNTVWSNFSTSALAAFRIIGTGAKTLGATIWSAIGGLPGLIISAATAGVMYAVSEYQELSQKIKQTQDELKDRRNQVGKFLQENNVAAVESSGDTKGIDNLIEAYKDKLKELAPYNFNNLVMNAEEKKSHTERLQYLENELKLLKEANEVAANKMHNRVFYSDLEDVVKDTQEKLTNRLNMRANAMMPNASQGEKDLYANEKAYEGYIEKLKDTLVNKFGNIGKDDKMREAAQQAMSSIFSELGVPEDKADMIRASVLQAFGCGDRSSWLQGEVANDMMSLINTSFPLIGEKIKASIPLNEAEKAKVRELMDDAKSGLISKYPELERTLQGMLNKSRFQAVIELVVSTTGKLNDTQSEIVGRIPGMLEGEALSKYISRAEEYGKDNSFYSARNAAKTNIDNAFNNYQSAVKSKSKQAEKLRQEYLTEKQIAKTLLNYDYAGEGKKSNKPGKKNTGRQEDKELKALQERIESFKKARQAYQARKPYMSWDAAKESVYELFPNIKGLNLDDYLGSIAKITPSDAWFQKSEDRKKYLSTINKEKADWSLSEELKPEFERIAADFNAALEEGASQFDLYKTLLEKTGSKDYAMKAFKNGALWDDESLGLAEQFKQEMNGMEVDFNASDATAKHYLVDIKGNQKAYDLWKKIVAIVKGNFTDALKEQAELIEKALSYEEQIANIEGKYAKIIEKANKLGDTRAATIARQQRQKEIGDVNLKKFKNSEDYLNFYGAIYSLGAKNAQSIAQQIKTNLNRALASGAISAREYGEEVERLQSQLEKLGSVQPSFLNGGLNGMMQSMKNQGSSQMSAGQNKYDFYKKLYDQAEQNGDLSGWLSAQDGMEAGQIMSQGGEQLMQGASEMQGAIGIIDTIIHGINDLVQGLNDTFQDIKETAEALGTDTNSDEWSDYGTFFSSFSSASNSATKGWDSLKEGNMGGVISGVVGSFTGWIKGFAQGHDKKLDNQIKIAEQQQKLLQNISDNTSTVVEQTLGGIYNYKPTDYATKNLESIKSDYEKRKSLEAQLNGTSSSGLKTAFTNNVSSFSDAGMSILTGGLSGLFSSKSKKLQKEINKIVNYSEDTYKAVCDALNKQTAYHTEKATLQAQLDALKSQRDAEAAKKNSDDGKLADYDKQIEDLRLQVENFTQSFLKDIYSIDMKSWASELTDAVVSAWQNGEDAVDAYREKVKDMIKDVTKNIVTQKIMESALSEPLKYLTSILDNKGQLDETDMDSLADMLYQVGDTVVPQITGIFDALKNRGWDFRENGSSSTTNSIKSITEETADLLASYLNSIRLYCAEDNVNLKKMLDFVQGEIPKLSVISQAQLTQLNAIAQNTLRSADASERIESILNSVVIGTKYLHMK